MFCVAAALSSVVVFNSQGALDEVQLELVATLFSDAADAAAAGGARPSPHTPALIWTLRDFTLALRDDRGTPLTPKQYLETTLGRSSADVDDSLERRSLGGRTGALLRRLVPRRDCAVMPRPVADEKLLHSAARLAPSTLRPRWNHALAELRRRHRLLTVSRTPSTAAAPATRRASGWHRRWPHAGRRGRRGVLCSERHGGEHFGHASRGCVCRRRAASKGEGRPRRGPRRAQPRASVCNAALVTAVAASALPGRSADGGHRGVSRFAALPFRCGRCAGHGR